MNEFAEIAKREGELLNSAVRKMERSMVAWVVRDRDRGRISPAYADSMLEALSSGESPLWWLKVEEATDDEREVAWLVHKVITERDRAARALEGDDCDDTDRHKVDANA